MPRHCFLPFAFVVLASSAQAGSLQNALNKSLQMSGLEGADISVFVERVRDDNTLFAYQADKALIPASNIKLITTAASLHYLGPDFRFQTEFLGELQSDGQLTSDLHIVGNGDPYLTPERLWYVANRLRSMGLREIKGDITLDNSYFAGNGEANGFEQDSSSFAYMAPSAAISLGFNAVSVVVRPGEKKDAPPRVMLDPPNNYARIKNTAKTVGRGRTGLNVSISQEHGQDVVYVSGRIRQDADGLAYWRRITQPAIYFGHVLKGLLGDMNIKVHGSIRVDTENKNLPRLYTLQSARLAELNNWVNKYSNNFMAAQVARAVGAHVHGAPATWDKAEQAINNFLVKHVGLTSDSFSLKNASGLHDVNTFSTRHFGKLLKYMSKRPRIWPEYATSLAVSGGTGTLGGRMTRTEAERMLRGKTGTLSVASALSGYVRNRAGDLLVFSILVNNYRRDIRRVLNFQDTVGEILAMSGRGQIVFPGEGPAATSHLDTQHQLDTWVVK